MSLCGDEFVYGCVLIYKRESLEASVILLGLAATTMALSKLGRGIEYIRSSVSGTSTHQQGHASYKMLLIGQTGSGKTSFLNFICNAERIQALGFADASKGFRPFHDIKLENAEARKMESKTSGAKLYETTICGLNVGVVDSPGFGDSRGLKRDKENAEEIIRALSSEDYVNCICLVINGRESRMSTTLKYVLSEITSILPRVVLDNIIVVFTNCADALDVNFDVTALEQYFGQPITEDRIFCIENPYCRYEKARKKQHSLPKEMIAKSLLKMFESAREMLTELHKTIAKFDAVHTHHFEKLYRKKQEIERNTLRLLTEYDHQKDLEAEIKKVEEEAEAASRTKHLNEEYKTTQTFERWVQVPTDCHNTLCGARGCFTNCHAPCHLEKSFNKEAFKHCASMGGGDVCTVCHHRYDVHYHNEVRHVQRTEEVDLIDNETKQRFLEAKGTEEKKRVILAGYVRKRSATIEKRRRLTQELHDTIVEFEELGISRSYAKLLENQIAVIKQRIQAETGGDAQDLREVKEKLEKAYRLVLQAL